MGTPCTFRLVENYSQTGIIFGFISCIKESFLDRASFLFLSSRISYLSSELCTFLISLDLSLSEHTHIYRSLSSITASLPPYLHTYLPTYHSPTQKCLPTNAPPEPPPSTGSATASPKSTSTLPHRPTARTTNRARHLPCSPSRIGSASTRSGKPRTGDGAGWNGSRG